MLYVKVTLRGICRRRRVNVITLFLPFLHANSVLRLVTDGLVKEGNEGVKSRRAEKNFMPFSRKVTVAGRMTIPRVTRDVFHEGTFI